jgi:hypothetical protein
MECGPLASSLPGIVGHTGSSPVDCRNGTKMPVEGGLNDYRGWRLEDHRRICIGSPVWPPERADSDADPWAAKPMKTSKFVEAMVEPVAAEPMPDPPRMPYSGAS